MGDGGSDLHHRRPVRSHFKEATTGANALVELDYATHAAYSFHAGTVANAAPVAAGGFGGTPKLTRISVVRYFTQLDDPAAYSGPPPQLVMRSVDFAPAQPVGYLENFQIAYTIGIAAPVDQDDPPDPIQERQEWLRLSRCRCRVDGGEHVVGCAYHGDRALHIGGPRGCF